MVKRSLAEAKAHLSELVDEAEHKKKSTLIVRHGKPAAVLVPVEIGAPERTPIAPMSEAEAAAFFEEFARLGDPTFDAVGDLLSGRR